MFGGVRKIFAVWADARKASEIQYLESEISFAKQGFKMLYPAGPFYGSYNAAEISDEAAQMIIQSSQKRIKELCSSMKGRSKELRCDLL